MYQKNQTGVKHGKTQSAGLRRVLWILLVRSCTVCLVFCLCLDFPLFWIFVVIILSALFVFIFRCDVLGSTLHTPLSTLLVLNMLLLFRLYWLFLPSVCSIVSC